LIFTKKKAEKARVGRKGRGRRRRRKGKEKGEGEEG
jgi:hypothetical protein